MEDNLIELLENVEQVDIEIEGRNQIRLRMKSEIHEVVSSSKVIVAMPIYEGRRFPLDIGKRILIFFNKNNEGIYSFNGLVVQRDLKNEIPVISVQRVTPVRKTQRRDYFRLDVVMDAKVLIPDGVIKEKRIFKGKIEEVEEVKYNEIDIVSKDISGGGLRAISSYKIELGTMVILVLYLDKKKIEIHSEVMRCNVMTDSIIRYDLGLKFKEMDEKTRSAVISFIFDRQRNLRKKGLI